VRGPGRCEALEGPRPSMRVSGAISDSSRVGYRSPFCRPEHVLTKLPDGPARRPMTAEEYFISSRSFNHKSYNLLFSPARALEMSGPDSKDNQTVSEINIPTQRAGLCLKSLIDVWPLAQAQPGLDSDTVLVQRELEFCLLQISYFYFWSCLPANVDHLGGSTPNPPEFTRHQGGSSGYLGSGVGEL